MYCPNCGRENSDRAAFCAGCGKRFNRQLTCPNCGNSIRPDSAFCDVCGCSVQSAKRRTEQAQIYYSNDTATRKIERRNSDSFKSDRSNNRHKKTKQKRHNFLPVLIILLCILSVGIAFRFFAQTYFEKDTVRSEYQTLYSNGDVVYCPPVEEIILDKASGTAYYDNLIIAYLLSDISDSEADVLAKSIGGSVAGHVSGTINSIQIATKGLSFNELAEKVDILMQDAKVDYAAYEMPVYYVENASVWGGDSDIGNEENPSGNDWWAEAIGAWTAWEYYEDYNVGNPIIVGILDSGFDTGHEEFQRDGRSILKVINDVNSDGDHGTHVAGLIAAQNNAVGIKGIAYPASLICEVWDNQNRPLTISNILHWYDDMIHSAETDNLPIVINNSWATKVIQIDDLSNAEEKEVLIQNNSDLLESGYHAIAVLRQFILNAENDFLFVQAAGNGYYSNKGEPLYSGYDISYGLGNFFGGITKELYNKYLSRICGGSSSEPVFEEIMSHVIIVAAVENNLSNGSYKFADFSNYGSGVTLAAPGVHIYSSVHNNQYENMDGTSMAAPIVSGAAALLWSMDHTLTAGEVKDILVNHNGGNTAVGVTGEDTGRLYPMLNIGEAMKFVVANLQRRSIIFDSFIKPDWLSYYQPVFDAAIQAMRCAKGLDNTYDWENSYQFDMELCGSIDGGLRLGYRLQDIDQNGKPELIIGLYEKTPRPHEDQNNCILALFKLDDNNSPVQLFESVVRGMYYFSSLGDFSCRGSGGAGDTVGNVYEMRDGELFVIESGGNNSIPGQSYSSDQLHYFHFKCPEGIPMVNKHYQSDSFEYEYRDFSDSWYELRDQSTVAQDEATDFAWGLINYNLPIGDLEPIEEIISDYHEELDSLKVMLQQFYLYLQYTGGQYDCTTSDAISPNIMEKLIGNESCALYDLYPGESDDLVWNNVSFDSSYYDPQHRYAQSFCYDAEKVDWILSNIFNCSSDLIQRMRQQGDLPSSYYYYQDGKYYKVYGAKDGAFEVRINYSYQENEKIHVDFSVYYDPYYGNEYIGDFSASVELKRISGNYYWSIYSCEASNDSVIPTYSPVPADKQYGINIFLSNFSEQDFPGYTADMDLASLYRFAFLYANYNGRGRYNLSTQELNGNYYFTLPFDDLNTIIRRFFDRELPETARYICTSPDEYGSFYQDGYYFTLAASGEIYTKFTVANSISDIGDGKYVVDFGVYELDWQYLSSATSIPSEIYSLNKDNVYSKAQYLNSGTAIVKPYDNNGIPSYQLLSYQLK